MSSTLNAATSGGLTMTSDTSGILKLQTAGTDAVTITAAQNVGIGTASPSVKLQVKGGNGNQAIFDNAGERFTQVNWNNNSTTKSAIWLDNTNSLFELYGYSGVGMTFSTNATERMRIDSSGNLLWGITAQTNTPANGIVTQNPTGASQQLIGHANGSGSGTYYNAFLYNSNIIGSITQNGTTATAYNTSSDYRLKENVQPLSGALARVAALKPCTYNWKSAPEEIGEGFIAHELAEVCPNAVTGEKDATRMEEYEITPAVPATYDEEGNELTPAVEAVMGEREVPVYQGIDTSFLVATLTAAIKEMKEIIDQQSERITALEGAAQ